MQRPVLIYGLIGIVVVLLAAAFAFFQFYIRFSFNNNASSTASGGSASLLQSAGTAFNGNDFTAAIKNTDAALAQNQNDVSALLTKAETLAQEGSLTFKEKEYGPQAIALAQQALAVDPNNSDAWRIIGYANEIMQNYSAAHDAYTKSLAIDPKNVLTISQEAHAYDLQGELTKAEAEYRAALKLDPTLDQAQMGLGRILFGQHKFTEAITLFEGAASSTQNVRLKAEALYSAGTLTGLSNNHVSAAQFMQEASVTDPSYPLAWVGLGTQLFAEAMATSSSLSLSERNSRLKDSLDDLQKAVQLNSLQTAASYQLGIELAALGQKDVAIKILTEAKNAVPQDITLGALEKQQVLAQINSAMEAIENKTSL